MNKIPVAALFALSATALFAADFSFEGRWLLNELPQSLKTTTCTVSFYSSADAASPVATLSAVPFTTDKEGYFVVSANAPSTLPDTFWAGVAPAGHGEISPRFRVAPAPFALAAVEAELATSETQFTLTGQAAVERLEVTGSIAVGDLSTANGQAITAANLQVDSLRLSSLSLDGGDSIGLFDTASRVSSPSFDSFSYDESYRVEAQTRMDVYGWSTIYYDLYSYDGSGSYTKSFDSDGILLIALSANPKKCPAPQISLTVGPATVLDALPIGSDESEVNVERIISMPYRAGENIALTLKARGKNGLVEERGTWTSSSVEDRYKASISVKLRLVRFGRK